MVFRRTIRLGSTSSSSSAASTISPMTTNPQNAHVTLTSELRRFEAWMMDATGTAGATGTATKGGTTAAVPTVTWAEVDREINHVLPIAIGMREVDTVLCGVSELLLRRRRNQPEVAEGNDANHLPTETWLKLLEAACWAGAETATTRYFCGSTSKPLHNGLEIRSKSTTTLTEEGELSSSLLEDANATLDAVPTHMQTFFPQLSKVTSLDQRRHYDRVVAALPYTNGVVPLSLRCATGDGSMVLDLLEVYVNVEGIVALERFNPEKHPMIPFEVFEGILKALKCFSSGVTLEQLERLSKLLCTYPIGAPKKVASDSATAASIDTEAVMRGTAGSEPSSTSTTHDDEDTPQVTSSGGGSSVAARAGESNGDFDDFDAGEEALGLDDGATSTTTGDGGGNSASPITAEGEGQESVTVEESSNEWVEPYITFLLGLSAVDGGYRGVGRKVAADANAHSSTAAAERSLVGLLAAWGLIRDTPVGTVPLHRIAEVSEYAAQRIQLDTYPVALGSIKSLKGTKGHVEGGETTAPRRQVLTPLLNATRTVMETILTWNENEKTNPLDLTEEKIAQLRGSMQWAQLRVALVEQTDTFADIADEVFKENEAGRRFEHFEVIIEHAVTVANDLDFAVEKLRDIVAGLPKGALPTSEAASLLRMHKVVITALCKVDSIQQEEQQHDPQQPQVGVVGMLGASKTNASVSVNANLDTAYNLVLLHKYHGLLIDSELVEVFAKAMAPRGDCRLFNLVDVCTLFSGNKVRQEVIVRLFETCCAAGDHYRARAMHHILLDEFPGYIAKVDHRVRGYLRTLGVIQPPPKSMFDDDLCQKRDRFSPQSKLYHGAKGNLNLGPGAAGEEGVGSPPSPTAPFAPMMYEGIRKISTKAVQSSSSPGAEGSSNSNSNSGSGSGATGGGGKANQSSGGRSFHNKKSGGSGSVSGSGGSRSNYKPRGDK